MIRLYPEIYMLSSPTIDWDEINRFLQNRSLDWARTEGASASEELVEFSGRICYMSFKNDTSKVRYPNSEYIANLIDKGHESVLEHANWSFLLDRVSRAFTHQLVRHRIGFAYSQLSQQYHDESDADFVMPVNLQSNPVLEEAWRQFTKETKAKYREFINVLEDDVSGSVEARRLARSTARSVLPNSTETAIVITANARSLRHFLSVRGDIEGDLEMRMVCAGLYKFLSKSAPSLFSDYELEVCQDGFESVRRVNN